METEYILIWFQREYYTTLLKRWIDTSLEELESIAGMEKSAYKNETLIL